MANTKALDTKNVTSIIDSDPRKNGLELKGAKIYRPDLVELNTKTVAAVISSRASESAIYVALSRRSDIVAKIIRLYDEPL